jgi:hypothetical protein
MICEDRWCILDLMFLSMLFMGLESTQQYALERTFFGDKIALSANQGLHSPLRNRNGLNIAVRACEETHGRET